MYFAPYYSFYPMANFSWFQNPELFYNPSLLNVDQQIQTPRTASFSPMVIQNNPLPCQIGTTSDGIIEKNQNKKQRKIQKKSDEDYNPNTVVKKKSKKIEQPQNRNVIPNVIRLVLSFTQRKQRSQMIVRKLFSKFEHSENWSVKRFYLFQNVVKGKLNNYVNEETLSKLVQTYPQEFDIYPEQQQRYYNKISRVIIHQFLRQESSLCLLTSKRMKRNKTFEHLQAQKYLVNKLTEMFDC